MFDIAEYWRLAIKHRFLILGAFLGALVIGTAITLLTTPTYTAVATIQIERATARVFDAEDVAPAESPYAGEEFFQTQYALLKSRSLAERVVDSLGLANSNAFIEQMGVTPPAREGSASSALQGRRELAIALVQGNLNVAPIRGSRLVSVSFDSPNPATSAQLANAISDSFIQANLDRRFESSQYAREFLEGLIEQTKARLEESERQLVSYATEQQIINLTEGGQEQQQQPQSLVGINLAALNASLAQARAARIAAEEKWRQASGTPVLNLPEVLQNPSFQRLSEERARLDAQYQQNSSVYQPEWPAQQQLKAQIDELDRQIDVIARAVRSSIQGQYTVAANQERALQAQVDGLSGDVLDLRYRSIQYNILQRELDTSRTLYEGLLQRYKEVGVTGAVAANNISIVDRAQVPGGPSKPQLLLNLAIAALLGLGFGIGAAFLLEALDESLASPDDVENKLSIPVLGVVPLLNKDQTPGQALADPRSSFSEAYYSIRTALQFSTPDGAPKTLLVTSSRPAEGKSTTAYALAMSLARIGNRVLLVDGDLRNPSMHRVVGVDNDRGMSNLLSGSADISAVAVRTREENLDFVPCGPLPPNPAELWGGDRVRRVLEDAIAHYDHVVIDGPPVLGFADAPVLATAVTGTIFVLEARSTRRAQARGALRRLAMGRGRLLGAVLTKFNVKATQYGGYDYAYDYTYGGDATNKKATRR